MNHKDYYEKLTVNFPNISSFQQEIINIIWKLIHEGNLHLNWEINIALPENTNSEEETTWNCDRWEFPMRKKTMGFPRHARKLTEK